MTTFPIATFDLREGGRIGVCPLPGRVGGLEADLKSIVAWQPAVVLSMTEWGEMKAIGSDVLGARLQDHGIDWVHFPIHDFGGPLGADREAWPGLAVRLHGLLDTGHGVLFHCRAGQGRAGMMALRVMVERGADPDAALVGLRRKRPGAVETREQFTWAAEGRSS
ncbi:MAG: protein phosphatase [Rhodospirillaceae bacterium]|nr:protein phosphatase [Rhodospirillaceae bacterium]|tara:strand:- start:1727 stop:2221 length:495 start_codon:yes stop_codon:yes gene_type:complete